MPAAEQLVALYRRCRERDHRPSDRPLGRPARFARLRRLLSWHR